MKKILFSFLFISMMLSMVLCLPKTSISVSQQTCEYRENPLDINITQLRFSWTLTSSKRNQLQTVYEIIVSDNLNDIKVNKGNVWSSGIVNSNRNIHIPFSGHPLQSFIRYYWKVRIYDSEEQASLWSETAWFETAMMSDNDWKTKWISDNNTTPENKVDFYKDNPVPLFRHTFNVTQKVTNTQLYITEMGYYEPYLNGGKIGEQMLDPGWITYGEQILYVTYDISGNIQKGDNTIDIMAGNGWYNPLPFNMWCSPARNLKQYLDYGKPTVKALLRITYQDGSVEEVYTNKNWKAALSPIIRNNIYLGEVYDARQEQPGWTLPGTTLKNAKATTETEGPKGIKWLKIPQYKI